MHNIQSPRADDAGIEAEIQAKGLTAPRVTPADIEANIASEHYFTAGDGAHGAALASGQDRSSYPSAFDLVTFCVLMLRNGTKIVGVNYGTIDPAQHDEACGRREAREDATRQVWPLMGYELRSKLSTQ